MDSLTQIALGSAVGVAVMGRRTAVWKAALWGAVAGTLPDLDAFIDHGDAILNMTRHRAESHALVLITPPLLDAMTVYGTQLLLPFTNHPYGVGSVFIIDLAYTLPLIVGTVAALRMKDLARGLRWNAMGLILSTA